MVGLQLGHAYAFIGGAFVGRFTGIIPSIIISGVLLYVADPSIYTNHNIMNSKEVVINMVKDLMK